MYADHFFCLRYVGQFFRKLIAYEQSNFYEKTFKFLKGHSFEL